MEGYKRQSVEKKISESEKKKIDDFLKRKRGEIFWNLAHNGVMTQKALAEISNTTPTSLSNILQKFEDFQPKLIEGKSEGRKRLYRLSNVGLEYSQYEFEENLKEREKKNIPYEELRMLQEMMDSLDKIKVKYDDWEIVIDDMLVKKLYGISGDYDEDDEKHLNSFINYLESAILKGADIIVEKAMNALECSILKNRMERFLDVFYAFRPFYEKIEKSENIYDIYDFIKKVIVVGPSQECKEITEKIGLVEESEKIISVLQMLKEYIKGKSGEEIYKKMEEFMPGMNELNAYLAFCFEIK